MKTLLFALLFMFLGGLITYGMVCEDMIKVMCDGHLTYEPVDEVDDKSTTDSIVSMITAFDSKVSPELKDNSDGYKGGAISRNALLSMIGNEPEAEYINFRFGYKGGSSTLATEKGKVILFMSTKSLEHPVSEMSRANIISSDNGTTDCFCPTKCN